MFIDEEGILVVAMRCAAIFDNAKTAGRDLIGDAMIKEDDAIGDVFFKALAREGSFAALAGDDGGDAFVFEPAKKAAEFAAEDRNVAEAAEEGFNGVERDAF